MSNPISNNMDNEHKKEWPPHFWLKLNTEETRVLDMVEQEMPSPHKEYLSLTEHQAQITSLEAMLEEKQKRIEALEAAIKHVLFMPNGNDHNYLSISICGHLDKALAASAKGE